ncbi:MAG: FtsX-like permease family protein [Clostridiales bacterium]|nr:FtsX-like permease family protein [Clostridiales bacterium]
MIKFLLKGILRDRSRSLFPFLTVTIGVMLTVFLYCYIKGAESNFIESSARFSTGHVKIMSRAYAAEADQIPNDLAYVGVESLLLELRQEFPDMVWTPRIRFGGLLDIPDEAGETRSQGTVAGLAVDLFGSDSPERLIINIEKAVVSGHLPRKQGEILISADLATTLDVRPGDTATLIGSTMHGSMAITNFTVAGTIRFGVTAMDRGAVLADIHDIQEALDMEDAAGEILGFYRGFIYKDKDAEDMASRFNARHHGQGESDEFLPVMVTLKNQSGLADLLAMMGMFSSVVVLIFVAAMSIVLWNAGLMGSLRRYGEIGVRLAMGEDKGHLYRSLIAESMLIAVFGTIAGTTVGVAIAYYIQVHGIDISSFMKSSSLMVTDVLRAQVTPVSFVIGFLPGLGATFIGTSISGIGIYRRKTSTLMKELE